MVFPSALAYLPVHWGFIGLDVGAADQLSPHRSDHRGEQFAHPQYPTIERRPAEFQTRVPLQDRALSIQWSMVAVLADDCVDHDLVTGQALLDDPWRQGRRDHTPFLARLASTLLAFRDQHEVLRRLYIQLGAYLVADHCRLFPAAFADTLLGGTCQDPLYPRKVRWQFLPPRMLALRLRRGLHRWAFTFRLDFHTADSRLQF